jgi:hypothetical protein
VADGDWKAVFRDADGIGCNVFMLGEPGTEVFLTDTPYEVASQGWDYKVDDVDRRMPLLIVRRKTGYTIFIAVHQPFRGEAPPLEMKRDGRKVEIQGQGYHDIIDIEMMRFKREIIS